MGKNTILDRRDNVIELKKLESANSCLNNVCDPEETLLLLFSMSTTFSSGTNMQNSLILGKYLKHRGR